MDSITQIAVGIATVEAIAGDKLKNKSFLIGAMLGSLPDADIWIGKLFPYEIELAMHRGFSHSLLGIILLSPLIGFFLNKCLPRIRFQLAVMLVAACFATHIAIDLCTSWGVQLLYPLDARFSLKTIFVIDIFYTIPWLVALMVVFKNRSMSIRGQWLKRGFVFSSVYLFLTIIVKLYVLQQVNASFKQHSWQVDDYIVKPTFSNILLWNINVKYGHTYYVGDYSLFDKKPIQYDTISYDTVYAAYWERQAAVQTLRQVSENWYTITPIDTHRAAFNDLRFGWLDMPTGERQFVFAYALAQHSAYVEVAPMPKTLRDGRGALKKIWERIWNNN